MSRLIDADDLKNVFEGYSCTENPNPHFPLDMVKKDIDKAPPVEAVPMVHLDVEKSEILDTLDKMQFFLGQRAGRELWNDKPENVQEKDLENFNRDIEKIKEYLWNVKPVKRGEWLGDKWWRECSECGNVVSSSKTTKFCIECGADMRTSSK